MGVSLVASCSAIICSTLIRLVFTREIRRWNDGEKLLFTDFRTNRFFVCLYFAKKKITPKCPYNCGGNNIFCVKFSDVYGCEFSIEFAVRVHESVYTLRLFQKSGWAMRAIPISYYLPSFTEPNDLVWENIEKMRTPP